MRKNDYHINRLLHKDYGETKRWNTYTISRAGEIYEHYNPEYYSDFLNIKNVDKKSISIILENMGGLVNISQDKYVNWLDEVCETSKVVEKRFMGQRYWETIPSVQLQSLTMLCNHLCEKFDIEKKIILFHHYHQDVENFKGIVFRSNYIEDSIDLNAMLDIEMLNEMFNP